MTTQESGGLVTLIVIVTMVIGSMIWGLKFWFWFFLFGCGVIVVAILMWLWTLLTGATRWAKRQ